MEAGRIVHSSDDERIFHVIAGEYQSLGIDLNLLHNNLEQNYSALLERLVSLGFATIRPDGEVRIEAD